MLLAHKKISGLQNLASLYNRRLPNMEGDQVVQQVNSLQTTSQWGCKHNCIISLHEVLKCFEKMKFNSCDIEYIIQIIIYIFLPLTKCVFKANEACQVFSGHKFGRVNVAVLVGFQCPLPYIQPILR